MAADQRNLSAGARKAPRGALRVAVLAIGSAAILLLAQLNGSPAGARARSGVFDYYALALSWSPTYCASEAGESDGQQCAPGRRFAFVVHGLWPQFEQGWPEDCDTQERWVPEADIESMLDIMPSRRLVIHEWKKHGSCSGLRLRDYLAKTRSLFAKIKIPARYLAPNSDIAITPKRLAEDFVKTNRDLALEMISVQCGNRQDQARLSELRVCFDRQGEFRACGGNERRQCRARSLVLPRVR